jgi:hypothetical protein
MLRFVGAQLGLVGMLVISPMMLGGGAIAQQQIEGRSHHSTRRSPLQPPWPPDRQTFFREVRLFEDFSASFKG